MAGLFRDGGPVFAGEGTAGSHPSGSDAAGAFRGRKVVDVIRYFAASVNITSLYKVKLMKLMWYADALAYKKRGAAITGLVYQALPMRAVPVGHNSIIDLRGVPCEEIDLGETNAYRFSLNKTFPVCRTIEVRQTD